MKDKKLTMSDIAKMAGVGKSTVSRYFNGGYIKEETRLKLKKVIDENNYEPSTLAQSLKAKYTKVIGIVVPCLDSITTSRVLMTMDQYLKDHGYTTLIINTNHDEMRELTSIEQLWRMNVDGIILMATAVTMAHQNIAAKLDIPLLFVAQRYGAGVSIINDDYSAGYEVGKYAAYMGHRKICYIGVSGKDEAVGIYRKDGVINGLRDNGVSSVDLLETDFSLEKAHLIALDYLKKKQPTLFIGATDNIALGCLKAINELKLKMPDDISLIGFGGYETSQFINPSLSTVRFNNEETGIKVGQTIIDLIEGNVVDNLQLIGYTLIKGQSVKDLNK
ncbi:LacI family DNA-binding transcriptional regulator [Thomasclavelia ramosa]|uniref:LacI family DNA-binding transcriptional regulator n=1 Tax=Thomasclavelia ramosa TaxID=1547 RepID=UPI00203046AD|nr:LacI family DNA-binding transcriptional regulator [Thomasclavelia ramosa]MCM1646771.1 LacI family DNA-binding transcriptional regulator [Thomasclavelia ramosa]